MTDAPGGYQPPSERGLGNGSQTGPTATTNTASTVAGPPVTATPSHASPSRTDAAKDEARNVVQESRRQVKDLTREVGSQVNEQAGAQKDRASSGLRSLSDQLRSMAENAQQSGPATDLAHQAADTLGEAAYWLDSRDPGQLVDEVRNAARRRPGSFLIGAAVAGVLVGRLTRGAVQAAREADSGPAGSPGYDGSAGLPYPASSAGSAPTSSTAPRSGSFAGESYPSDTPIADETAQVIVVEDPTVSSASPAGRDR